MGTFIMLIGLPGSGKSTFAVTLAEVHNAIILSSDAIREELFQKMDHQEDNNLIFETMNKRANHLIGNGENVIYDATNVGRKKRRHLIQHVIKANEKIAYYVNEHISTTKVRNAQRNRKVGEFVIERMYKSLQVPVLNEGWHKIRFTTPTFTSVVDSRNILEKLMLGEVDHDTLFTELARIIPDFQGIYDLPQDSSYHSFSVSRHTYYVYEKVKEDTKNEDMILLWTALFHDLGKAFCKSFCNYKGEKTRYANFIGHEHVSAQLAAYWLFALGYDEAFIKDVVTLVQFHMVPTQASEKKLKEVEWLIGSSLFQKLMLLHEADMQAK
ncbi:AAA family ATPase [Metabacillus iocasae]|uniref:Kinase n=1 Tax=Priestia iocasae TaxID=2291674 RepID=A0ABS2QVG6_9BACI|nr:putative kinase [Metabacillus iocasae]